MCRECTQHYADAGTPWQCNVCKQWHVEENFPAKHRQRQCSFYRVCLTCEAKKPCFACKVPKPESDFGPAAWKARNADRRICKVCAQRIRGCWTCAQCEERKSEEEFSIWHRSHACGRNGRQTCDRCCWQNCRCNEQPCAVTIAPDARKSYRRCGKTLPRDASKDNRKACRPCNRLLHLRKGETLRASKQFSDTPVLSATLKLAAQSKPD